MLLIDSAPALDISVKEFEFGVFCFKNVRVTAPYGLKPRYYKPILLLAGMEVDDLLEAVTVVLLTGLK